VIERGVAIAALVLPIGFLDLPIMDQRVMRMAAGRESVAEGEFRLLQGRERVFEKRALLHLPYLLSHRAIGGIGVLGGFDGELDASRVWLEDTQAAVRGTVVGIELFERGRDERLPEPHLGLIAERVAFE
jgi:hypothetical protein